MPRRIPARPAHPERICWGCEAYCSANDLRCGNGKERTQHPVETFGPEWMQFVLASEEGSAVPEGLAVPEPHTPQA